MQCRLAAPDALCGLQEGINTTLMLRCNDHSIIPVFLDPSKLPRCTGEADQEIAKASAADPTGRTFALGGDSDYFIFERCRYIHFRGLKVKTKQKKSWSLTHRQCRVSTPSRRFFSLEIHGIMTYVTHRKTSLGWISYLRMGALYIQWLYFCTATPEFLSFL